MERIQKSDTSQNASTVNVDFPFKEMTQLYFIPQIVKLDQTA